MPRKPMRLKKEQRKIPENIFQFLCDELPNPYDDCDIFLLQEADIRKLWDELKIEIMAAWISKHPGRRPTLWWRFNSPGPRERIGGKGQLISEKYPAVFQAYERGLPTGWDSIDAGDPPCFSSEAAYLDRHELLTPAEKKVLAKMPEAWEPEKVCFDEEENEEENYGLSSVQ